MRNILLVDDEPGTLSRYKEFLLNIEGYNVDAFSDSQKAENFAQVNPPCNDLVVMDIRIPGPNGLQVQVKGTRYLQQFLSAAYGKAKVKSRSFVVRQR